MRNSTENKSVFILMLVALLGGSISVQAQHFPSQEKFGKNRVQYRTFNWKVLQTSNFEVYFYQNGTNLARLTAQLAETEFDRITEVLGYTPYNKIKIFLYNSPEEQLQSNLGLATFEERNIKDIDPDLSRIEIAFTGDQTSFRQKIVRDVSRLFVYDMLYGGNLKDALQNSLLLTLPEWFMSGIANYVAEGWSPQLNDYTYDLIQKRDIRRPSLLEGEDAALIGQSIWNYIAQRYGKDNISNILNLTRIIRTEQNSITSTLGVSTFGRFLKEWRDFYQYQVQTNASSYSELQPSWSHKIGNLNMLRTGVNFRLSPDGKLIAYSEPHKRNYRVSVYNLETKKRIVVRQGGLLEGASSKNGVVPLVAWSKNNELAVLVPAYGKHAVYVYEGITGKRPKIKTKSNLKGLDHIVGMDLSKDGSMLAVSADKNGQNDLYLISVNRGSAIPLTNDLYDDLTPRFIGNSNRKVAFASNRPSDSLTVKGDFKSIRPQLALYAHEGTPRLATATKLVDSLGTFNTPIAATEEDLYFLSDVKGIKNIFRYNFATARIHQNSNSIGSLQQATVSLDGNGGLAYLRVNKGDVSIAYTNQFNRSAVGETPIVSHSGMTATKSTIATSNVAPAAIVESTPTETPKLVLRPGEVDTDNYIFDEDVIQVIEPNFRSRNGLGGAIPTASRTRQRDNIAISGPTNYKGLFFRNDGASTWKIDPIKGFGFQQHISMNDLLENHVIKAGGFLGLGNGLFKNYDGFVEYNLNKYRVDFGARYDRNVIFVGNSSMPLAKKYRYNQISVSASYPFSRTTRISISPSYTSTHLITTGTARPTLSSHYAGVKTEFVFDNSISTGVNMTEGTKFKIRYENHLGLTGATDGFYRVAGDLRHYQKVHRDIILAVRLAGSHSGGKAPKNVSLGGMENWVSRRYDNSKSNEYDPFNFSEGVDNRDIFFTEFATNLRGFNLNRLVGTTYILGNAELRVPLIKYLYRGPINSTFLRNFQIAGFTDIGTAWTGKGPFSQENSLNTEYIGGNGLPFQATVVNFRNPYIWGYGVGVRTTLFGVYGKIDYAWGIDNTVRQKGIPYVTLGYDF